MQAETLLENAAYRQGWTPYTQKTLLVRFIQEQIDANPVVGEAFQHFLNEIEESDESATEEQ